MKFIPSLFLDNIVHGDESVHQNIFQKAFIYSLFLLPVGLLFGEVPTSVAEIIVFVFWLLSGNWKNVQSLKNNLFFWTTSFVYFIHLIGLFYTTDFNYALNDLRVKIPLLFFPLIFFTSDTSHKQILLLLKWYVVVVLINLSYLWINALFQPNVSDSRNISIFISHIRLGLMAALSVVTSAYLIINYLETKVQKILYTLIGIITLFLMIKLGLITGLLTAIITAFFSIIYMLLRKSNRLYLYIISAITIIFILLGYIYIRSISKKYFPDIKESHYYTKTINGNLYSNQQLPYTENGHYVFTNICDEELSKEWNKRSHLSFDGKDKKNNELKYTLYRYLASKGLTKDSAGISQLSDEDITNIENGCPNYLYAKADFLEKRIYELLQEYKYFKISGDPNGKTIVLRLFYWKIGWNIWMKNFLAGVGTGDVQQAFDNEYKQHPNIQKHTQLRAHNQLLTIALTFGMIGLFIFILSIVYPLIKLNHTNDYLLYFMFAVISILSFFIDDTFETQPGVTFYALFNALLIKFCLEYSE